MKFVGDDSYVLMIETISIGIPVITRRLGHGLVDEDTSPVARLTAHARIGGVDRPVPGV